MLAPSKRIGPRAVAAAAAAVVAVAFLAVWAIGERAPTWYPPCPFHALTGLQCPGCGSSRALHLLVHGEWRHALGFNPLLVLSLPLLAIWGAHAAWRALRHDLPPAVLPRPTAAITLVVLLLFFVLRNLPWWPFVLLAPHG